MTNPKRQPGRPRFGVEPMRKRNVMLSQGDVKAAQYIGDGNVSRGIRIALDFAMTEQRRYQAYLADKQVAEETSATERHGKRI